MSTVRITFLSIQATIFLNVPKGIVHQSTLTSMVTLLGRAIHQLLLTEGHESSCLKCMLTLQ